MTDALAEPRISKRKYQQHGTIANQKLGHKLRGRAIAARRDAAEAFYVDRARENAIGIDPKYRHGIVDRSAEASAAWVKSAKAWNAEHDAVVPPKVDSRKFRRRDSAARPARTYRAARRNTWRTGKFGGMVRPA